VDRRRRHIRPVRPDGLLGVELRRHRGRDVRLRDGTLVRRGDRIAEIHLRNERVREAVGRRGWTAIADAREDLEALLRWCARQPEADRPAAVHAYTILGPLLVRGGFERRPRRQTPRARLDGWFMRWLMGRFSASGASRLAAGHGALQPADFWLPVPRPPGAGGSDPIGRIGGEGQHVEGARPSRDADPAQYSTPDRPAAAGTEPRRPVARLGHAHEVHA